RQEARERGSDRRRLPGGLRRGLPHADARGAHAPQIARAGAAPRRGAGRGPPLSEHQVTAPLRQRADGALHDSFLQQALTIATTKFIDLRREAFAVFPEGEALRDRARAIKEATLQRLDHHIERLGGHVHYAANSEEARRIVVDIARRADARMAVKSKSMATEEIDLNEALEREGITPVETDLGEYIIQLAHE